MNKQEIVTVLRELNKITHFRVSLHGADYEEIAAFPESALPFCAAVNSVGREHAACLDCASLACRAALEKKDTHIYKCRYGLTEAVSPLYNFGTLTGFLMMGQVAESPEEAESALARLRTLIGDGTDIPIPIVSPDMTGSFVRIMTICAQYLTLSNAIRTKKPSIGEAAKKYITENYDTKITVKDICHELGCSKSTLLSSFKRQYGITVGDFITEYRLGEAKRLLECGEQSINEIAHETGFYDQSYFSKVFSSVCGKSPSEYRRELRLAEGGGEQ